ncbi:glycosyltransferase [Geodermatophilus nigrescens]
MDTVPDIGSDGGTQPVDLAGRRVMLVASTGGHLTELRGLAPVIGAVDRTWVTFDSDQSRSELRGESVTLVPYVRPRDVLGTLRALGHIWRAVRRERPEVVVSTGAAVAVSAFLAARLFRVPCVYIESVARLEGPSLAGRLVAALRLADLYTQQPSWAGHRWRPHPSVLATFHVLRPPDAAAEVTHPRLFVTLGTIRPYRFDSLVDAVLASGLADDRTVWQLGSTTRDDLPGRAVSMMPAEDMETCMREADVVVTHAGVGTVLTALEAGVHPVAVPRRGARGEHVDDHQSQIAGLLRDLGLALVLDAEEVAGADLRSVIGCRVVQTVPPA